MAPIPWTVISGVVTVQLIVKLNVLLVLYVNETVPVTGDPAEFAREVRLNVVVCPGVREVEPKFPAWNPALNVGGLVSRLNVPELVLRTVICCTSCVLSGVMPML